MNRWYIRACGASRFRDYRKKTFDTSKQARKFVKKQAKKGFTLEATNVPPLMF